MRANTCKTKLKWCLSFLQPNAPPFSGFRARFWALLGGKRTCSWSISTKALPE